MGKKFVKVGVYALCAVILVIGVLSYLGNRHNYIIEQKNTQGKSMYPFLEDGDILVVHPNKAVREGDIIRFGCLVEKCKGGEKYDEVVAIKFLSKISEDGNCFQTQGRQDYWFENGVEMKSFDSRDYGWLCRDEINMYGYVDVIKNPTGFIGRLVVPIRLHFVSF